MKRTVLFLLLTLTCAQMTLAGGPWPQVKGQGYFKLYEWWTVFDQHYTDAGRIDPNITTGIFNTSLYAEYGLHDRLTGVLNFPFFSRNFMNNVVSGTTGEVTIPGEAINALGDAEIGLKYALTRPGATVPMAVSVIAGLPLGKAKAGQLDNLQTGDGEFNQLLLLDVGKGFNLTNNTVAYVSGFVGFNNRTNGFSDEFRAGIEAGLGLFQQKLWPIVRLTNVESFKNGETAATTTSTSIFANNTEFTTLTVELNYYLTQKVGISAAVGSALRGEIIAARPSYSVGVFLDLSK